MMFSKQFRHYPACPGNLSEAVVPQVWIARMNRAMTVLLVFLLLLPFTTNAHDEIKPRLISVNGKAEKTYDPDKVDITLTLEGRAKELSEAKAKHDKLLASLHRITAQFGIDKKQVKTLSNQIRPRYEYRKQSGKQVMAGYTASHRVKVTFKQLKKTGDLVNALTKAGIDRLESMNFGLVDSNAAEREVMLMAVKDARQKATQVASSLGVSAPIVYSVNVQGGGGYHPQPVAMPRMAMMASAPMEAAPAPTVPTGDVTIRQNVSAQFEIQ